MKSIKILPIILIQMIICCYFVKGQKGQITGIVYGLAEDNKKVPLPGVNIYWINTQTGTSADNDGKFKISRKGIAAPKLVVSFVGYKSDTIFVDKEQNNLEIVLTELHELDEVLISETRQGTIISRMEPIQTQTITITELCRAACCNLSESFETNASVDVNYTDAVTGAKQIQLLGLSGTYVQLMTENIPALRGLATTYGLSYIPGTWMESIQISKGAGSVINGYESVTGQINVEYKKPDSKEKFYVNLFGNHEGKTEANLNASVALSDKWTTMILAHTEQMPFKIDMNHDTFLDMPLLSQYNLFNRWKYKTKDVIIQFGIKYLDEKRTGGQLNYNTHLPVNETNGYGIGINTQRYEAFIKAGYIFPKNPETSIAIISNASDHRQNSFFGLNIYDAIQYSMYTNLIYQTEFDEEKHNISTGLDYKFDEYNEILNDSVYNTIESIPGVYFQHTWHYQKIFTIMSGLRGDYHDIHGFYLSPRLHLKYDVNEHTTIRGSAGKGHRTSNIITENIYILSSSRKVIINETPGQEQAWNYGINFIKQIPLFKNRNMTISGEFYRTDFVNQIIVDMDADVSQVRIYNLTGKSYSNSFQIEATGEPVKHLNLTAAFRYTDVKATINNNLLEKPFVNRYKGLLTVSYATNLRKWQFDYTLQVNGDGRVPSTEANLEPYRRSGTFPAYVIMNAQISKFFRTWSVYLGVENLTDFIQEEPIIAPEDPFGQYFDASLVWGPLTGRMFYAGLRYSFEKKDN
ncbi:MAG: TonB-dependent receptor [Bacteroidia bacterium]|nr:TonB-dependent receptor [Bacteroidia bacterium]